MEVGQREGESDADYAQRMIDTAHEIVDPKSVELQAKSYLYNSVKDRLNELLPAYKSKAVLNAIVDAGGYEKLQPIKDQWPMLKKKNWKKILEMLLKLKTRIVLLKSCFIIA